MRWVAVCSGLIAATRVGKSNRPYVVSKSRPAVFCAQSQISPSMATNHEIANFFGVYLLYSRNETCKGHTYIGFTVDPNRRVNQHNKGSKSGGAKRTSGRGPWDMVLIVHGFPNKISALRFEWAWQNPHKSRRLKSIDGKTKSRKEKGYEYKVRVLSMMLSSGPWNRLPLTVRWLKQEYVREFPPNCAPPLHMAVAYGPVKAVCRVNKTAAAKRLQSDDLPNISNSRCTVCNNTLCEKDDTTLRCYHSGCVMEGHDTCLARRFLRDEPEHLVPVEGQCPLGEHNLLWGHLVAFKHGVLPVPEM